MNLRLDGKRALVTGAAQGMGEAIAVALADAGATVAVHARSREGAAATAGRIAGSGGKAAPFAADLAKDDAIAGLAPGVLDWLGGVDIVVNNAGIIGMATAEMMDTDLFDRTIGINLRAPWLVTKALLPAMRKAGQGGRLLFNASVSGKLSEVSGTAYNASKAGVIAMVRCLAAEVGSAGITVNAVCPGWVDTPMARRCWEELTSPGTPTVETFEAGMRANMLNAMIVPEDIAAMFVFLASDAGRCLTAQAINVDAGLCYW